MGRQALTWRASGRSRIGAAVGAFVLVGGIGVDSALVQDNGIRDLVIPLVAAGLAVWVFAYRPSVSVEGSCLVVRNPFWTRRIPLAAVIDVQPGYGGLEIKRRGGRGAVAWAVPKSNLMAWFSKHETRADHVAAAIRAELPAALPANR